jgi:hypothetical protein
MCSRGWDRVRCGLTRSCGDDRSEEGDRYRDSGEVNQLHDAPSFALLQSPTVPRDAESVAARHMCEIHAPSAVLSASNRGEGRCRWSRGAAKLLPHGADSGNRPQHGDHGGSGVSSGRVLVEMPVLDGLSATRRIAALDLAPVIVVPTSTERPVLSKGEADE